MYDHTAWGIQPPAKPTAQMPLASNHVESIPAPFDKAVAAEGTLATLKTGHAPGS